MATFTYTPSYSSSVANQPSILKATFGDGYEQTSDNGINNKPKVWKLTFNNIVNTDADTIEAFFTTNKTYTTSFDWTDPNGVAGKYKCEKWDRTYDNATSSAITCEFRQVFF